MKKSGLHLVHAVRILFCEKYIQHIQRYIRQFKHYLRKTGLKTAIKKPNPQKDSAFILLFKFISRKTSDFVVIIANDAQSLVKVFQVEVFIWSMEVFRCETEAH